MKLFLPSGTEVAGDLPDGCTEESLVLTCLVGDIEDSFTRALDLPLSFSQGVQTLIAAASGHNDGTFLDPMTDDDYENDVHEFVLSVVVADTDDDGVSRRR